MTDEDDELLDKAARLRRAREQLSHYKTAAEAARAMRVNEATYSGHENGTRGFRAGQALKYAQFYKIDLQWLLYGFGNPRGPGIIEKIAALPAPKRVEAERYIDYLLGEQVGIRREARDRGKS